VQVSDDATIRFTPSEDAAVPCCQGKRRIPRTWVGSEVLGAIELQHQRSPAVQLFTCHLKSTASPKNLRRLQKESPLTCTAADAGAIVCEIQQRVASRSQHLGPGTIVIISNSKAGQGRYESIGHLELLRRGSIQCRLQHLLTGARAFRVTNKANQSCNDDNFKRQNDP
jgi:hypothetical protein